MHTIMLNKRALYLSKHFIHMKFNKIRNTFSDLRIETDERSLNATHDYYLDMWLIICVV